MNLLELYLQNYIWVEIFDYLWIYYEGTLLQDQELQTVEEYIKNLKEKIEKVHTYVRRKLSLKSSRVKVQYDRKARQVLFEEGQKV